MNVRRWLLAWLLLAATGGAFAQELDVTPAPASTCLKPLERAEPEYPFEEFKRGATGRVSAEFRFVLPDRGPDVSIISDEGGHAFVGAVRAYAAQLRAPCHDASGKAARLRFDFVFQPDERKVAWAAPQDVDAKNLSERWKCVRTSGRKRPEYPEDAQRNGVQGRVHARVRFESPDQPPSVKVYAPARSRELAESVSRWLKRAQMPCLGEEAWEGDVVFVFTFDKSAYGFNPGQDLKTMLPLIKGIRGATLDFDTRQMQCPFDVKLRYLAPLLPNKVGELGESMASRRPLLEWLKTIQLAVNEHKESLIFADDLSLHVPCMHLRLSPGAGAVNTSNSTSTGEVQ
jgi:hypothetical protein